jgi:excisionase family DNA binding protein
MSAPQSKQTKKALQQTMTVRAALALHREGITVAEAAAIIGCDKSTVRELVRIGQLQGWKVGKHRKGKEPTAVRVSSESCYAYRERNTICGVDDSSQKTTRSQRPRPRRDSAVLAETIASLRKLGVRV